MASSQPRSPIKPLWKERRASCIAKKYFCGKKKVTPPVSSIVEFTCRRVLVDKLFGMQWKIEDGARSHGLGDKGGKGLPLFNEELEQGSITWRIVFVKRARR
mmetsp:Transcript_22851/g.51408  ORF Transcript_22851/g.51408 Transcript_22851/m.51408 type:complete len:102 (+) Transcript_22851:305-610(+)